VLQCRTALIPFRLAGGQVSGFGNWLRFAFFCN
jgi:hypothetical protein